MADDRRQTSDPDNPEWTEEDFGKARPFKEMFPEQFEAWRANRQDHETTKVRFEIRLSADVVEKIQATGPQYNERVEKVLREALAHGKL